MKNNLRQIQIEDFKFNRLHRVMRLLALVALPALTTQAYSQEPDEEEDFSTIEEIVVTAAGTNISGVKATGSKIDVLDRDDIINSGLNNVTDLLRTLPQIQNIGVFTEGGTVGGANNTQGNAIDIRGMGAGATLILVDGKRVANTGTAASFTESNQLPLAALERVEVISDGASAVYGSDAVAGVVNYIIRKDYEGLEITGKVSDLGGYNEWLGSVTGGTAWDFGNFGQGNIILSFEHTDRDSYVEGNNPYLRQDLSQYGGLDGRLSGAIATPGIPGNIVVATVDPDGPCFPGFCPGPLDAPQNPDIPQAGANTYWGLPAGTTGVGLTPGDLLLNQPNIVDSSDYEDFLGDMQRDQFSIFLNQELSENLEFYFQGSYTSRDTYSRTLTTNSSISLPSTSPFYIEGITDVAPGSPLTVQYNHFKDTGNTNFTNYQETYTATTGLKFNLTAGWEGEIYYTTSEDEVCGFCNLGNNINNDAFQYWVNQGVINPLTSTALPADQVALYTGDNTQVSINSMDDFVLKFNGPLFSLPAGELRAAVGIERLETEQHLINMANRGIENIFGLDTETNSNRVGKSWFVEFNIPAISESQGIPLVQSLTFTAAYRQDDYSDAGESKNPKLGFNWDLSEQFTIRGSWGESFRAPGLSEQNPGVFSVRFLTPFPNNSGNPDIANGVAPGITNNLVLIGGNPELGPETAESWSLGFDITPNAIEGLNVGVNYYNISYIDRIQGPAWADFLSSPENSSIYDPYITPINNPASCVEGDSSTYDPLLVPFLEAQALFGAPITSACTINVVSDGRNTNIAGTEQDGIDLTIDYQWETNIGFFSVNGMVSKILNNTIKVTALSDEKDELDLYSSPAGLRTRASLNWFYSNWNANVYLNYTGSYTNDNPITIDGVPQEQHKVDSWTTFDSSLTYTVPQSSSMEWARDLRLTMSMQNMFDEDPNVVLSGSTAYNNAKSDAFGRKLSLEFSKALF